jgi:hypothetical protein
MSMRSQCGFRTKRIVFLSSALAPSLLSDVRRRTLHLDAGLATAAERPGSAALHEAIADFKSEILWDQWPF